MPVRFAKRLAQETLDDFETIGRVDPFLNVPDDPDHSDGGLIACKRTVPGHVDCKTAVTFSEDAYRYEIEKASHTLSMRATVSCGRCASGGVQRSTTGTYRGPFRSRPTHRHGVPTMTSVVALCTGLGPRRSTSAEVQPIRVASSRMGADKRTSGPQTASADAADRAVVDRL
jgi:hypothetical protein